MMNAPMVTSAAETCSRIINGRKASGRLAGNHIARPVASNTSPANSITQKKYFWPRLKRSMGGRFSSSLRIPVGVEAAQQRPTPRACSPTSEPNVHASAERVRGSPRKGTAAPLWAGQAGGGQPRERRSFGEYWPFREHVCRLPVNRKAEKFALNKSGSPRATLP